MGKFFQQSFSSFFFGGGQLPMLIEALVYYRYALLDNIPCLRVGTISGGNVLAGCQISVLILPASDCMHGMRQSEA